MSVAISPPPSPTSPSSLIESRLPSFERVGRRSGQADQAVRVEHRRRGRRHDLLGRYVDVDGRDREVVILPGAQGSALLVDRDARTLGNRRLVAHLASDEPAENAAIACGCYLQDSKGRFGRRVSAEDFETAPLGEEEQLNGGTGLGPGEVELIDSQGRGHRLEIVAGERCSREVRWCRHGPDVERVGLELVSMRDVIAGMESYEPARSLTVEAIAAYRGERQVSVATLESELERVDRSQLVLNRRLREETLAVIEREGSSMSEIARRCGRVKRDSRGRASGETSWLARRLGIMPNFGESAPTPWIHSDLLGRIAREGLRISPREVELG